MLNKKCTLMKEIFFSSLISGILNFFSLSSVFWTSRRVALATKMKVKYLKIKFLVNVSKMRIIIEIYLLPYLREWRVQEYAGCWVFSMPRSSCCFKQSSPKMMDSFLRRNFQPIMVWRFYVLMRFCSLESLFGKTACWKCIFTRKWE